MKRNQRKIREGKGNERPLPGDGTITVTLNQIVDYAKGLDDKDEAERLELMCYRMLGRRLTAEAADKIAEIPEQFKKKNTPTIKKFVTINKGDKVGKKTVIPRVGNYNETVTRQDNSILISQVCEQKRLKLSNE